MKTFHIENANGFASLLRYIVFARKSYTIKFLADELNVALGDMCRYIFGVLVFPLDLVPSLYLATGDMRFISFLIDSCNLAVYDLLKLDLEESAPAFNQALATHRECSDVLVVLVRLSVDRRVEEGELQKIKAEVLAAKARRAVCLKVAHEIGQKANG